MIRDDVERARETERLKQEEATAAHLHDKLLFLRIQLEAVENSVACRRQSILRYDRRSRKAAEVDE